MVGFAIGMIPWRIPEDHAVFRCCERRQAAQINAEPAQGLQISFGHVHLFHGVSFLGRRSSLCDGCGQEAIAGADCRGSCAPSADFLELTVWSDCRPK